MNEGGENVVSGKRPGVVLSPRLGLCQIAGSSPAGGTETECPTVGPAAGYEIVGQSSDARQQIAVWHPGRAALLRAVRKGLVDDVFVTRLSQFSRKRSRLRRILVLLQRKGVCVHTTEIDLRYDLYRHGLDSVLV